MNPLLHIARLLIIASWAILLAISSAHASVDCITDRALYEDKSAQMSFEQAQQQHYVPIGLMLNEGYSDSAFWLKLRLDPSKCLSHLPNEKFNEYLILRIQPVYLDEVQLFDPIAPGSAPRITGDRYSWHTDEYKSLNFNFVVPTGEPRDIWLRLKTSSTNLMRAQAFSFNDISTEDKTQDLAFGVYIALIGLIFLGSIIMWWLTRDWLTAIFALNQLSSLMLCITLMGFYRIFMSGLVSPQTVDVSLSIIILTFTFITSLFQYVFYRQFGNKVWVTVFFALVMLCYPFNLFLLMIGHARLSMNINMVSIWVMSLMLLPLPLVAIDWHNLNKPILSKRALFGLYFACNLLTWLAIPPLLGIFSASTFAPYASLPYGLVSGMIFLIFLHYRYRLMQNQKLLEVTQARAVAENEKIKREEQSKFLNMLTHELTTSLSLIKMGTTKKNPSEQLKGHIQEAINDMTEVINRCALGDKAENQLIKLQHQPCDIHQLLTDLANQYGATGRLQFTEQADFVLETDPQLLRVILGNLISNAIKYGKEDSIVEIRVIQAQVHNTDGIAIEVINEVGDLGPPDPERIFEKYYRSPKAHKKTGSGLGLYLVRSFLDMMGGRIDCHSTTKNTIFTVYLPLAPSNNSCDN